MMFHRFKEYFDEVDGSKQAMIVKNFHELAYYSDAQFMTYWCGNNIIKHPCDLQTLHELIWFHKPDVIVETGTATGGSALFYANMLDLAVSGGRVITIDLRNNPHLKRGMELPKHPRITYLTGSSVDPKIFRKVKRLIKPADKVMVVLDADHTGNHVFKELKLYHRLVTVGQYLIVEDTNINGHPLELAEEGAKDGFGPMEGLCKFMKINHDFVIDKRQEKFLMTFNPNGFLQRIK